MGTQGACPCTCTLSGSSEHPPSHLVLGSGITGGDNNTVPPQHWLGLALRRETLAVSLL